MKEYWQQLSQRDQRLLVFMVSSITLALFYFGFWSPLQTGIEDNRLRLDAQSKQLVTMKQQAQEVKQLKRSGKGSRRSVATSGSLLSIVERTAVQLKIRTALKNFKPEGQDGVTLQIENISFDQLIEWLKLLKQQYGIFVNDLSVERRDEVGRVDSRIMLRIVL
jgi:general secretion pathway protein M